MFDPFNIVTLWYFWFAFGACCGVAGSLWIIKIFPPERYQTAEVLRLKRLIERRTPADQASQVSIDIVVVRSVEAETLMLQP
jgi:hypothetical protein